MGIWDAVINDKEDNKRELPESCIRIGEVCPNCKKGTLEYDGKLNLVCPVCKTEFSAGFT